jgi:hypothetical protein
MRALLTWGLSAEPTPTGGVCPPSARWPAPGLEIGSEALLSLAWSFVVARACWMLTTGSRWLPGVNKGCLAWHWQVHMSGRASTALASMSTSWASEIEVGAAARSIRQDCRAAAIGARRWSATHSSIGWAAWASWRRVTAK